MILKYLCPVCHSPFIETFLTREGVPVHQNLPMTDKYSALKINRGRLILACCGECGFVFNQAYEPNKLSYCKDYDNTQLYSPLFDDYLSNLVEYLVIKRCIRESRIIEVGCGKGQFIKRLVEFEGAGNVGLGFDPSYVGPGTTLNGRLTFIKSFFDARYTKIPADVVVCRHVIEHVPDPLNMLNGIKEALKNSPKAKVFFETPCVEWILSNKIIWDFFYEHCSYFNAESLTTAFQIAGFNVEKVQHAFGGQYLWLEATISNNKCDVSKDPGRVPHYAQEFGTSEYKILAGFEKQILNLSAQGGVALWGAGAKGVTFANLVDPNCRQISCIIDLNPKKQGKYIPGAGHPIISFEEIANYGIKNIILMNQNYRQEVADLMKKCCLDVELIDLAV